MIYGLPQWVKKSGIASAMAQFQSLAREFSYAAGIAIKKKKAIINTFRHKNAELMTNKPILREVLKEAIYGRKMVPEVNTDGHKGMESVGNCGYVGLMHKIILSFMPSLKI